MSVKATRKTKRLMHVSKKIPKEEFEKYNINKQIGRSRRRKKDSVYDITLVWSGARTVKFRALSGFVERRVVEMG